jgi:maltose/maltodextrin transport system substrate-binding protein
MKFHASILLLASFVVSCVPLAATAWEDGKLLLWINGDKGYNGLQRVGYRFERELGVPVKVEHPENPTDKYFQAAKGGQGPDILLWAHDRLGEWADAGLLLPVDVEAAYRTNFFDKGWTAFMHHGKLWGYPVALEVVGLIYNKALITEPPATLNDLFALKDIFAARKQNVIMWDYNNTYFTWGVLAGSGAYVFGRDAAGNYNPRDVGVNTTGAVRAVEVMLELINRDVMPRGVTYSVMEARMNAGELGLMISGPWAWSNLKQSHIDFDIAPIPGVDGAVGRPFIGVLGAMLNRTSPNKDLAKEFLEHYMLTDEGLREIDQDVPLGVPALKSYYAVLASNPHIRNSMRNVELGEVMPNIPQMGRFWSAMQSALSTVTSGQATPREALDNARQRIIAE